MFSRKTRLTRKSLFRGGENEITYKTEAALSLSRIEALSKRRKFARSLARSLASRQRQPLPRKVGNFFGRHVENIVQLFGATKTFLCNVFGFDVRRCNVPPRCVSPSDKIGPSPTLDQSPRSSRRDEASREKEKFRRVHLAKSLREAASAGNEGKPIRAGARDLIHLVSFL